MTILAEDGTPLFLEDNSGAYLLDEVLSEVSEILLPNSTITATGPVTIQGGVATHWEALADFSGSNYSEYEGSTACVLEVGLSNPTGATPNIALDVTIYVECGDFMGTGIASVTLFEGTTALTASQDLRGVTSFLYILVPLGESNQIVDWNNLRLRFNIDGTAFDDIFDIYYAGLGVNGG